jgi:uncharacterized tellurite resistance protein B-like protein
MHIRHYIRLSQLRYSAILNAEFLINTIKYLSPKPGKKRIGTAMSLVNFAKITKLLSDNKHRAKHKQELFQEVMLMVLARVTRADSNVETVEIEKVQQVLKDELDQDFSVAEIRTASSSEVFERESLESFLSTATRKLDENERMVILASLKKVIRSDDIIRSFELDFFDRVALSLRATPSEIAGLSAD